jgi:amino acid transporter
MQTQMSREEAQKVVSWLCPLPSSGAYVSLQNALGRRLPGTGNWFIESNVFKDWMASRHRTIWITGLPGSGKTVLCASAIREVLANSTDNTAVLYFFFDHRDPSKSTHENLVMTFARQMLESNRPSICMNYAKKLYDEKANNGVRAFNHDDYVPLIESFMMLFDSIFILCDALDESSDADDIASTLERLHFNNVPTRLLFTSRFDLQLEHRHEAITRRRVALAENMQPDIEQYVKTEVESSVAKRLLKLRDTTLRESIEGQVTKHAGT